VAKIAEEVGKKQRDTESDLAKAEPAVEAAMSALDTLDQKDLSSCKGMLKPPPKLDEVFAATMVLLAGIMPSVIITKSGKVKDASWDAAKKQLMGNIKEYMVYLKDIKRHVDDGSINQNLILPKTFGNTLNKIISMWRLSRLKIPPRLVCVRLYSTL
jgi:dynein heavy chain